MSLHNFARVAVLNGGTGTLSLGPAVPSFLSFGQAGVSDGETVTYAIEDGIGSGYLFTPSAREIGRGTWHAGTNTLSRDTVLASTDGGSRILVTTLAQVFIGAAAEDIVQSVTNDTNVTATISNGNLSLGWTAQLAVGRGGTGGGTASGTLLDNITGFSATGFLQRTGAGTYAFIADPLPVSHGGTGGAAASGALLDNISGFSATGLLTRTASGTYAFRSITAGTGIAVTNGSGVAGNPVVSTQPTLDVFLIVGDSNAVGQGSSASSPAVPAGTGLQYAADGTISVPNDPTKSAVNAAQDAATGSLWPAWSIAYGRLPGLVLTGVSGSTICTAADFGVGNGNWESTAAGSNFANAITALNAALIAYAAAGYNVTFKGAIIIGGSNDAAQIDSSVITKAQFSAGLTAFVANLRAATIGGTTYPHMPIWLPIIGTSTTASDTGYAQVRAAQFAFAAGDGDVSVPFVDLLSFNVRGLMNTGAHPTQAGYNLWGATMGANMVPRRSEIIPYKQFNANAAQPDAAPTGTIAHVIGKDATQAISLVDGYGGIPFFLTRAAGGTAAAPTNVLSGTVVGIFAAKGRGATGYQTANNGALVFTATEDHSDTVHGESVAVLVTANGTATPAQAALFDQDGITKIGPNASHGPTPLAGTWLQVIGANSATAITATIGFGGVAEYLMRTAGGTASAPTGPTSGTNLGIVAAQSYGATAWHTTNQGAVVYTATENHDDTHAGTKAAVFVTPNTTVTPKQSALFDQDGSLTLGLTSTFNGTLKFAGLTNGTASVVAQNAAGTPTITLPTGNGTVAVSASSPLVLDATTGALTAPTAVTSAASLTANRIVLGAGSQASQVLGSLGTTTTVLHGNAAGAPTFAAVSLTADVSGTLPIANGGTGVAAGGVATLTTDPITVDFSVAGDNAITVNFPAGALGQMGFVQYQIYGASVDIHLATFGIFTQTGGGGTAIVPSATAITVTTAAANTNNNTQEGNSTNITTQTYTPNSGTVQFRVVGTTTGTAKVRLLYKPL